MLVYCLEYLPYLQAQSICLSCGHLENAMGVPAGREAYPWAQMTGNLEDSAILVEVDGVDGEAHEAHVDAVARRNEQGRGGRQGAAQHEATEALPEGGSEVDGKGDAGPFYLKCFDLHEDFFL